MASNNNYGVVGYWHEPSFPDIKALEGDLCLGDRVEFRRDVGYAHWGIYVGQYRGMRHAVIHFGMFEGGPEFSKKKAMGIPSAASEKPEIRADTIGMIFGGSGRARINNSRDHQEKPLDPGVIIETAKKMHRDKTPIDYNLFSSNCEHFVNLCRYSHPHSDQITAALQTAGYTTLAVGAIGAVIAITSAVISPRTERR
ncbi:phospholipase A and acyltransferase 2-like [Patiria miniata]|uniref:LRAT domain-containing protein n=1 Tax=Patiria miniata TaxID=46514 RepID=A0A913ZS50_PATMI|nr:phospholipase A and acyltransferase 2-like [Patiria miniata]